MRVRWALIPVTAAALFGSGPATAVPQPHLLHRQIVGPQSLVVPVQSAMRSNNTGGPPRSMGGSTFGSRSVQPGSGIVIQVPPGRAQPPRDPKPPKVGNPKPPKCPPGSQRTGERRGCAPVVTVVPPVIGPPAGPVRVPPPPSILPPQRPAQGSGSPPVVVQQPEYVADEVLITVATAALPQIEADLAQSFNVVILERVPLPLIDARLVRMRIPDGRDVPAVVAAISADPRVGQAQPNFLYRQNGDAAAKAGPVAAAGSLLGLQYALTKLGTVEAHRFARGQGSRIAVIDSGVDATHPDLATARIEHFDATDETMATSDLDSHGTGIAGIIGARGNVIGVAPASELVSARVFRKAPGGPGSIATTVAVLKGMTWSIERNARVLNMSFAGPRDPLLERHVKAAAARGAISVAAAGNNGAAATPAYPAAYEDVIAVTAIDAQDRLYEKANRGSYVAIAAPGVDVIVAAVGHSHQFQSGTSFAAAHVSGIVALLLEVNPELTPDALREILMGASEDLGAPGRDAEFGAGRIDATKAVTLAAGTQSAKRAREAAPMARNEQAGSAP
jgi:subtilisin family serine protease